LGFVEFAVVKHLVRVVLLLAWRGGGDGVVVMMVAREGMEIHKLHPTHYIQSLIITGGSVAGCGGAGRGG
jgi:hypothetical protein